MFSQSIFKSVVAKSIWGTNKEHKSKQPRFCLFFASPWCDSFTNFTHFPSELTEGKPVNLFSLDFMITALTIFCSQLCQQVKVRNHFDTIFFRFRSLFFFSAQTVSAISTLSSSKGDCKWLVIFYSLYKCATKVKEWPNDQVKKLIFQTWGTKLTERTWPVLPTRFIGTLSESRKHIYW